MKPVKDNSNEIVFAALATAFNSIFTVDLATDTADAIFATETFEAVFHAIFPEGEKDAKYSVFVQNLADSVIHPDDRVLFLSTLGIRGLANAKKGTASTVDFKVVRGGLIRHQRVWIIPDSKDSNTVTLAMNDVEDSYRINKIQEDMDRYKENMIKTLARDYETVSYVDLHENKAEDTVYTFDNKGCIFSKIPGWNEERSYHNKLDLLYDYGVYDPDREAFYAATRRPVILENLRRTGTYAVNFRSVLSGELTHYQVRYTAEETNGEILGFVSGLRNIDDELAIAQMNRRELEKTIKLRTAELREKNVMLSNMSEGVFELLGNVVECRDRESGAHIHRVKTFSYVLATAVRKYCPEYNLSEEDVKLIASASALHDVGKVSIPDSILLKPGKLTPEEFSVMKTHCEEGVRLISKQANFWSERYLELGVDICRSHHEKWDGQGYPRGLKGDEIPIAAQIVSVADCYDALTSERIYKPSYDPESAFTMILNGDCGVFSEKLLICLQSVRDRFLTTAKTPLDVQGGETVPRPVAEGYFRNSLPVNDVTLPIIEKISEQMPGGFFIYHAEGDGELIFYNRLMATYFGCDSKDDFANYVRNSFRGIVHPDDYEEVRKSIEAQVTLNSDNLDHVIYRIIRKDGEVRWFEDWGHFAHSDIFGDIFYVFVNDITGNQSKMNAAVKYSELDRNNAILENLTRAKEGGENAAGLLNGTRILLVVDDRFSRDLSTELLEEEGATVVSVASGLEALNLIRSDEVFDVVLMDLVMPVMDGIIATREIRNFEKKTGTRMPIIALTAEGTDLQIQAVLKAGADDCMSKPLVIPELSRILINCMKERSVNMEKQLADTMRMANTDPLTKVKNATAFTAKVSDLTEKINADATIRFAVIVCDINDLKLENDNYGHDIGDRYIQNCSSLICDVFTHSPVYRVGGDEFAVFLQGADYDNSGMLLAQLENKVLTARAIPTSQEGKADFAYGISYYDPENDMSVSDVIKRADIEMYAKKNAMK